MDSQITLEDGTIIDKTVFQDLVDKQKGEFKLAPQITHKHLNVKYRGRQRVAPAFQLYSRRVSEALKFMYPTNQLKHKQANFIQLVNDFCDISNTRTKQQNSSRYTSPYGMFQNEQDELYEKAYHIFSTMVVGQRRTKSFAPFQRGLLMYIISIRGLLEDMKQPPINAKYLMTHKVNQDVLENVFSRLRSFGHFHTNPCATEVITRIKKLLLSWNFIDSKETSVAIESDENPGYDCVNFIKTPSCVIASEPFDLETEERIAMISPDVVPTSLAIEDFGYLGRIEEGGVEYVSGYIAGELRKSFPELCKTGAGEDRESFWVGKLSDGGLVEPSLHWHALFKKFNEYFEIVHGSTVYKGTGAYKNLEEAIVQNFPNVDVKIVKFFVRTRTNIRIAHLNRKIEDDKFKRHSNRNEVEPAGEILELSEEGEGIFSALNINFC